MAHHWMAEVFQNHFLPQGASEVHAIMTVTATGEAADASMASSAQLFGILCDVSGSMQGPKVRAAKEAMATLVTMLPETAAFFIVTGTTHAQVLYPTSQATPAHKTRALAAIRKIDAR